MKTKLLIFSLFAFGLSFGQATVSQFSNSPQNFISNPIGQQFSGQEIFRFRAGLVTQLDLGNNFDLSPTSPLNSRWFSVGSLNTGSQTVYGLRFQDRNKAITFGYNNINNANPRIQWIGTGAGLGDLEFRVANSFSSTTSTLLATMTKNGNTVFGTSNPFTNPAQLPRVGIVGDNNSVGLYVSSNTVGAEIFSTGGEGLRINSVNDPQQNTGAVIFSSGGLEDTGIFLRTSGVLQSIGIESFAEDAELNIGVRGTTFGIGGFEAGIYGETPNNNGNQFAAFFDGETFSSTGWGPSDVKLKENVTNEVNVLERLEKLRPVSYDYKKITEMNLPSQKQHGFISQELAEVFPELTKDIIKPVFDKEGKIVSKIEFKALNYEGLISVLTAGIQELNSEVKGLKAELAEYKSNELLRNSLNDSQNIDVKGFSMDQNVPNPFTAQTQIRFQLPKNINKASIIVFDLNGKLIKDYNLNQNSGLLNIESSDLGKGMFLYTLVYNGSEIITKKMIVK